MWLWGNFVESEIHEATKNCKTDKEAERKVTLVMNRIFRDEATGPTSKDEPPPIGQNRKELPAPQTSAARFADPADRFKK